MKTGKVAKALGIDRKTVSNWTDMDLFEPFFTPEARGIDRTQREYFESDVLVINTIRTLRNQGKDWDEIAAYLGRGEREQELPASAMLVETTAPIAQYGRIVELQTALEGAEEQIDYLREELRTLQSEAQKRLDEVRNQERQVAREREQQLLAEVIQLHKQIARLEFELELVQKKDGTSGNPNDPDK